MAPGAWDGSWAFHSAGTAIAGAGATTGRATGSKDRCRCGVLRSKHPMDDASRSEEPAKLAASRLAGMKASFPE